MSYQNDELEDDTLNTPLYNNRVSVSSGSMKHASGGVAPDDLTILDLTEKKSTWYSTLIGWPLLLCGVVGFAAQGAVYAKLIELGAANLLPDGTNPISSCAVLCIGGVISAAVFAVMYWKQLPTLRGMNAKQWRGLLVCTFCYSVIAQYLSFEAYARSDNIITVILIGRIEPIITLLATRFIYKETVHNESYISAAIIFTGICLAMFVVPAIEGTSIAFDSSVTYAFGASFAFSVNNTLSRKIIADLPVGVFLCFRAGVGAIFFFFLAWGLFGLEHFAYTFDPFVIGWMFLYAGCLAGLSNILFWTGIRSTDPGTISVLVSFFFVLSVVFAYIILLDVPDAAQITGSVFIIISIIYSQYNGYKRRQLDNASKHIQHESQKTEKYGGLSIGEEDQEDDHESAWIGGNFFSDTVDVIVTDWYSIDDNAYTVADVDKRMKGHGLDFMPPATI